MRRASLFTIFLIVFIDLVGFGILLPNLQYYGKTFGISNAFALVMLGPAFSLPQFIFSPLLGRWSDRIGRRPVLIFSQFGTLLSYLLMFGAHFVLPSSASAAIFILYATRVMGGACGGNISTASAYIADITTPENRAKGMGVLGAAFGLGFIFGPAIGGIVGSNWGLECVPITAAVFSAGALALSFFTLPESHHPGEANPEELRRFSLPGLRHALARPIIGGMILMFFVNGFAFAGMEQTLSLLVQLRANLTVRQAAFDTGLLFGGIGIIIVLVQGGLIHQLTKLLGEPKLVFLGPLLIAAGLLVIGSTGQPFVLPHWLEHLAARHEVMLPIWSGFIIGSALLALGSSLFTPSIQSLISRHAGKHEQGEILGANQGMASLARALGPILAGWLYASVSPGAPYFMAAAICAGVSGAALLRQHALRPPEGA